MVRSLARGSHHPANRPKQMRDADDDAAPRAVSPTLKFSTETRSLLDADYASNPKGYDDKLVRRTAALKAEILAIENHRNTLVPINQLPPEILSAIFDIVKARSKKSYGKPRLSWIRVSFVCRHWRTIALDSTSLWAAIDFMNPEIAELMLCRTKNSLLDVSCATYSASTKCEGVLRKILSQTRRLRNVFFDGNRISFSEAFADCSGPAPHLKSLTIRDLPSAPGRLPKRFLDGKPSSLRCLILERFDFVSSWEDLPFSASLNTLTLVAPRESQHPSLQGFFEATRSLRSLTQLTLENILPPTGFESLVADHSHLTFSQVTQLTLTEPLDAIVGFMRSFHLPKCGKFSLFLKSEAASMDSVTRFFGDLELAIKNYTRSSLAHSNSDLFLKEVGINNAHEQNHGNYTFTFQRERVGRKSSDVSVLVNLDRRALCAEDLLGMVHSQLNMSRLQLLDLSACGEIPESHWKTAFVHLADLKVIRFRYSSFSHFIDVMKQDPALPKRLSKSSHLNAGPAPTYFCALTTIEFSQARFQKAIVSQLGQCLKRRPTSWPTIELRIEKSNFTAQHAEVLEKAAPDVQVTWDARPTAQTPG
ncbi:hypothetical protein NMY22_g4316 [Coprinellus aureogranulatus]|nr:hypothetical protein NMY22_g4316 [Coprinellus aureogranulatus]